MIFNEHLLNYTVPTFVFCIACKCDLLLTFVYRAFPEGKRAVFLVNTVALVEQQADVLKRQLPVDDVGKYSGDMNLDFWNKNVWIEEFSKFQVSLSNAKSYEHFDFGNY